MLQIVYIIAINKKSVELPCNNSHTIASSSYAMDRAIIIMSSSRSMVASIGPYSAIEKHLHVHLILAIYTCRA